MSEDQGNYSRRQVLGAATGVGAVGLSAGAATRAYLLDRSVFSGNRLRAGTLTLELAGETATGGDRVSGFPTDDDFENGTAVAVDFPDLEPGDEGVFTAAYRLCDNPGRVWLRSRLVGAGDTDLEEYLGVGFSTRPDCGGSEKKTQFEGTLGEFHEAFSGGTLLGCRYAGKVEYEGGTFSAEDGTASWDGDEETATLEFETDDGESVVIELRVTETKEGDEEREIVGFDYEVLEGPGVCEVVVAGGADPGPENRGPKRKYYDYECAREGEGLTTPEKEGEDPGRKTDGYYGLSHVEFYVCDDCQGCPPACVDLTWRFDQNPPEELLGDSLRLELEFLAVQCRHQSEPTNPWS